MEDDIVLNGKNGDGRGLVIPIALFTLIVGGIIYVAITMTRISTQLELLQSYNTIQETRKEQDRKYYDDKLELYRLEVHKLDKDVALLQQTQTVIYRKDR